MVKVKIDYNPYLMETKVKFNGKEPRINSLIEKYYEYPIQMWVEHIPRILYDEMNGFDFDLEFSGTKMDYEELVKAFKSNGISSEEVRCIHERIIEGRVEKLQEIEELNQWLETNRNDRFDLEQYKSENREVFDDSYSIIIIGDTDLGEFNFEHTSISEEVISGINEIDNTKLEDTPIVFEADSISVFDLQAGITALIEKNDIHEEQIFFFIKNKDNAETYCRMITDLGIKNPQIIFGLQEECFMKYFELYPISSFIRKYISSLRFKIDEIEAGLRGEKEASDKANSEIVEQLSGIENRIIEIKESIQDTKKIAATSIQADWVEARNSAIEVIQNWKAKKTKITNYDEAKKLSEQFEEDLKIQWTRFLGSISKLAMDAKQNIFFECSEAFERGSLQTVDGNIDFEDIYSEESKLNGIKESFIKIKEEKYEKAKEGFFNAILKSGVQEEKDELLVISYPCQKWREYAIEIITPMIDRVISERSDELDQYRIGLTSDYLGKLEALLSERIEEKDSISTRLSSDIKKLQKDVNWLGAFKEKLEQVERG